MDDRFWEKVEKTETCWLWRAFIGAGGYGAVGFRGKTHRAHRVSWALTHGGILPVKDVLHVCDVPACVRPDHLYLGGDRENVRDRKNRGREGNHKGTANGRAILTPEQVIEIRRLHRERILGPKALAANYGVSVPTIWYVLKRGWKHVA